MLASQRSVDRSCESTGGACTNVVSLLFVISCDASGDDICVCRVRYLTGMVEKRTLEKYEREAKEKNRETW